MSIGPWDFNSFDIVVLVILLISLLHAASRGLVRELITIIGLSVAGLIALFIFGRFRAPVQDFIKPAWLADAVLAIGAFFLIYMLIVLLLGGITRSLRGRNLRITDRLMGAGFGVIRGLLIAALGVMVITAQYRSELDAQKFKDYVAENRHNLPDDFLQQPSVQKQLNAAAPQLPSMLSSSTFYPLLDRIGDGIRALPFAKAKSLADRISDGESADLF